MRAQMSFVALGAALAFLPTRAGASTGYPAELQSQLSLSYTPACSICHAGGDNDAGTVTTAFGTYMVSRGLVGGNNLASLDGAIAAMVGEKSIYLTYLQDDVDPNNPSTSPIPGVTYGCFNVTDEGPSSGGLGLLLVGLAVLCLVLPRRRRHASKERPAD
jgi:MYXO-CTERM domain-containing protein